MTSCYDFRPMNGQLSEHPLAELISEILEKGLSGALRVDRQRVRAVVYFEDGDLLYATANLRTLRLAAYAQKRGLPSDIVATAAPSDFDLAAALISRRLLTPEVLDTILVEQVSDVVRVLLLWTSGEWSFDERARLTAPVRVAIPTQQLLLEAARQLGSEVAAAAFRNTGELISPATAANEALSLSPTEGFLLSRVAVPLTLSELLNISGLPESEARRIVYGLTLAGILKREGWRYAFRANAPLTVKTPQPLAPKPAAAETTSAKPRSAQEELKDFLDQLARATNHYEVLGVPMAAEPDTIKQSYYSLARRFHPDRFHDLAGSEMHGRLEASFARITQAQEILSDPGSRAAYDAKLSALDRVGKPFAAAEMPLRSTDGGIGGGGDQALAEQRFKEGTAALQMGETNAAIACLSAAARLAPNRPQYRAYYGRALASHQQSRRLAEAELQAAVKLDPANAAYRVMLAGLYRDLGFSRRAITELERALALDAKNVEARSMLETLEARK
jgi:curved DNA-binding protein CbpA